MARANQSTTLILGLAAVGAGAAFFMSKKAKAETPGKDDVKPDKETDEKDDDDHHTDDTDKLPDVEPSKDHATFGSPYIVGDLQKNVTIAVATKPTVHPIGKSRGATDWNNWLANIVYWETWPSDPIKIASSSSPAASHWRQAKAAVDLALKPSTTKPGKDTTPKGHPTIGEPYRPGRANEEHNAAVAADKKPTAHPVGLSQGKQDQVQWLANVAYWESYPLAPVKIPAGDSEWARAWIRLRDMIAKALKVKPGETPKKNDKTDKKTGLFPTLGAPYRPGSDQEGANAKLAVKLLPKTHPRGESQGSKDLATWLTNVAYWEVWPAAPTKITDPKGGLAASWKRIFAAVKAALATTTPTKKTTPSTTPKTTPTKKTTPSTTPKTTPTKKTTPSTTPGGEPGWYPGDLQRNVKKAVDEKTSSYAGRTPKPTDKAIDWLTNVAYWATWPSAPLKIPKGDKTNAKKWLQARDAVAAYAGTSTKKTTPQKTTPTKQTTPSARAWKAGDLGNNVAKTVDEKILEYDGRTAKPTDKAIDWFANVAYWATWPSAPLKIPKGDKANAKKWIQARDAVSAYAGGGKVSGEPPESPTLPRDSSVGAEEIRNAALAVDSTDRGPDFIRRAATEAFNATYPQAKRDNAHALAAKRVLAHVQRGAALAKKLGPPPANWPHKDGKRWTPFAIALACSSALRSPEVIKAAVEQALTALNSDQVKVRGDEDMGSVLAETSQYMIVGKPLQNMDITQYPQTRAYMACAELL
jgi:hypothetical protein